MEVFELVELYQTICLPCDFKQIENEIHFMLFCLQYNVLRHLLSLRKMHLQYDGFFYINDYIKLYIKIML